MKSLELLTEQLETLQNEIDGIAAVVSALSGAFENPKDTPSPETTAESLCSIYYYLGRISKDLQQAAGTAAALTQDPRNADPAD